MTEAERKSIQKEIDGLRARIKWTHITPVQLAVYKAKLEDLKQKLNNS